MNTFQRMIKYSAIAFAVFLSVMIISGIASAVFAIVNILPGTAIRTGNWKNNETIDFSQTYTDVKSLYINHSTGKLNIRVGDEFRVEAANVPESFKASVNNNGELTISESNDGIKFLWFTIGRIYNLKSQITVYVPETFIAEKATLDAGAGNITIDGLHTKRLEINAGAGNIDGEGLTADKVSVDGGVGNVTLDDVKFTDAVFDCGVGKLDISGSLIGDTDISCGVGSVDLDLTGNVNNYSFKVDSGLGAVRLNGKKISGNHKANINAENMIQVDGGIGSVDISLDE